MEQYNRWLDDVYQKVADDLTFLELAFCSNDINKTISAINSVINPHIMNLDYSFVGKILFESLEAKYLEEFCDIRALANKAYGIWYMLPDCIDKLEPFFTLCYIDDPLSYGDENQTRELFNKLFTYYK